jgi:hypothetical protein
MAEAANVPSRRRLLFQSKTSIAARCVAEATFEAIYSWLEEDPKTRIPAAEVAKAVAHFNI